MDSRKYGSTACGSVPFQYQVTERLVDSEGRVLYWYVLADYHQMEIYKFDTEPEAIDFIQQCKLKEINVLGVFHGRQMELKKVDLLCPKD
jgi:hypothetical protein